VTNAIPEIYGLVLSGGKSSRMGRDKSTIIVHGKPQREYLLDELRAVCEKAFVSTKTPMPGFNCINDSFDIDSPLNGVLSAFKHTPGKSWLAVAVDMPYVDRTVLQFLVAARDPNKLATCFYNNDTGLPEPLLTIWEPAAFFPLTRFAETGHISPRDFLSTNDVCLIAPPDPKVFYNMNRPEDVV